jgi:N-acetylmuramoyl-L-alanine amidase
MTENEDDNNKLRRDLKFQTRSGRVRAMNLVANRHLLALLVLLGGNLAAEPSPVALRASRFEGRDYFRLADWARAGGLEARWSKRDETLQVANHAAKLSLTIDSREAQLNGVELWLSYPLLQKEGSVYVSRLDAETTLRPILAPPRNPSGAKVTQICLDPGHGGKDPGYCVGHNQEKKYALLLAQEVQSQLKSAGLKVIMTRTRDNYPELPERPEFANRKKADLFVSIHLNAAEISRETVQGSQVFCLTPAGASSTNVGGESGGGAGSVGNRCNDKNILLAYDVQKSLVQQLGVQDRGVRRARFAVLRDAEMPAILVEAGFMSHPVEGSKIFTPAYRRQLARAIVDGIMTYKRAVERTG